MSEPDPSFLFAASRDVQRDLTALSVTCRLTRFLFAASRDVQRDTALFKLLNQRRVVLCFYSLHRETLQRDRAASRPQACHLLRFYSLHRETYSVTGYRGIIMDLGGLVSIRCIARRTA